MVFVFATTEIERIPYTIVSRCQRFEFKRVSLTGLAAQLEHIAELVFFRRLVGFDTRSKMGGLVSAEAASAQGTEQMPQQSKSQEVDGFVGQLELR